MITLPLAFAALTAGAVGGVHCVGMCSGIAVFLSQAGPVKHQVIMMASESPSSCSSAVPAKNFRHQALLHGGRLFTYMLIGAVFGSFGAAGLLFKPVMPIQQILFVFGNLALVLLGLRLMGIHPLQWIPKGFTAPIERFVHRLMPAIRQGTRYPFLIGMSWGALPCGLLFGIAPFALLSGDAVSGAILMLLFGLAALPHLLLAQRAAKSSGAGRVKTFFRLSSAAILIVVGLLGLWYFDMANMPDFLCVTPTR